MFSVSHATLYRLSGLVWLAVGIVLLNTGLVFIMQGFTSHPFYPQLYSAMFTSLSSLVHGPDNAACVLIGIGLAIGLVKGRFVMRKAASKSFDRIKLLENPTPITNLYTKANIFILAAMMGLGMSMKYMALPCDIRGLIDAAVGAALMQGAVSYFHYASYAKVKKLR